MPKTIEQLEQELYYTEHYLIEARAKADDDFAEELLDIAIDLSKQIADMKNEELMRNMGC